MRGQKMILSITLDVPEEDVRLCISLAHRARFGSLLPVDQIKPFEVGDKMTPSDIENITMGSSLGQLVSDNEITVMRTE